MATVVGLVTAVDLEDGPGMSFSAVHSAVLDDGRRLTLLDDRGWSVSGPPDLPSLLSIAEIEDTAGVVVGPDEPFDDHTRADMERDHWAALAKTLRQQGVVIDAKALSRLPHEVELGERLRNRLL